MNEITAKGKNSIPKGKIVIKAHDDGSNGERAFELFVCDDGFVELYDAENPKEGFFFQEFRDFLYFVNSLNDVIENKAEASVKA